MKVKALRLGFYNNRRQKPGDIFHLSDANHFSENWMVKMESKEEVVKEESVKKVKAKKEERDLDVI